MSPRAIPIALLVLLVLLVTPFLGVPSEATEPAEIPEVETEVDALPEASPERSVSLEARLDLGEIQTPAPEGTAITADPLGDQPMSTFGRCETNPCPPGYTCVEICGEPQCFHF